MGRCGPSAFEVGGGKERRLEDEKIKMGWLDDWDELLWSLG